VALSFSTFQQPNPFRLLISGKTSVVLRACVFPHFDSAQHTVAKEKRRRLKEVLETSVTAYHGKILEYAGDGALSMFNSAIDGLNCAVEIQRTLQQEPKVDLRIGIHTGDISIEDGAIFGDGVNLWPMVA